MRSAAPADVERLERLAAPADAAFVATGRARFRSADAEVEGELELRIDPPERAWLEIRSRALFGMVGERVVASLPGDGWLVVLQERASRLERVPFDSTQIAWICPQGDPASFLALARGRLPAWLVGEAQRARAGAGSPAERFELDVAPERGGGTLLLRLDGDRLRELEWRVQGERRVWMRYERYESVGAGVVPTRLSLEAPGAGIQAELELLEVDARPGLGPADFEVGGTWNPVPNRGVDHDRGA